MTKATLKMKLLSLLIMLTMLVGMMPLSGIVSFAVGDANCEHIDENTEGICDICGGFISEPEREIFADEAVTLDIPDKDDGYLYVTFTPAVTGNYVIKATQSSSDPIAFLYDSEGAYVEMDDDSGEGRLFYMYTELEAGVTYYLAVADYSNSSSCTFIVRTVCDEHTPSEVVNCRGTICSVCEEYFGEPGDHIPVGPAICVGFLCSVCNSAYGEQDTDNHQDYSDDGYCDGCSIFVPNVEADVTLGERINLEFSGESESKFVKFVPEVSGAYLIKSYEVENTCDPVVSVHDSIGTPIYYNDDGATLQFYLEVELVAGETYYLKVTERDYGTACSFVVNTICDEHTPTDTVNCLGTLCAVCEEYYGNSNGVHTPSGILNCLGAFCSTCEEYYGDEFGDHNLVGEVTCLGTFCDVCLYYFGETGEHNLVGEATCLGTLCDVCYEYYGDEIGDHNLVGEVTCLGTRCEICLEYFGEKGEHTPLGEPNCMGTFCSTCNDYYGEPAYDHEDLDEDHRCDVCDIIMTDLVITVGNHEIPMVKSTTVYYVFVPAESGTYLFKSNSTNDPKITLYDEFGYSIESSDDINGSNFHLEIALEGGKTYYLGFYEFSVDNLCPVTINKLCDEHTPGEQNCLGYVCTACGEYFGEAGDHSFDALTSFDGYYHYSICVVCNGYYGTEHAYDENGDCECGYFVHEHVYDAYVYNDLEHWYACSLCDLFDFEYKLHDYDDSGVCVCGREQLVGVYLGTQLLLDGQYLDMDGNVSDTLPEDGYAYYKDGRLILNNFFIEGIDANDSGRINAIYTESDITIELIGLNGLYSYEDTIYVVGADLTIEGTGLLQVYSYGEYDAIDVDGGNLTINGGRFDVYGGDHGIEVYGTTEINNGVFEIEAGDDGMDVDELIINGGIFDIEAEDNGIDSSDYNITINGGTFDIDTNDDVGIESDTGSIIINGGTFDISADDQCIDALNVEINGGQFFFDARDGDAAIRGFESLIFGEDMGEMNVVFDELIEAYVWADEEDSAIYAGSIGMEDKMLINDVNVYNRNVLVSTGEEVSPEWELYDFESDEYLIEGVDYTIEYFDDSIVDPGIYNIIIHGMGNYVGSTVHVFYVHSCVDIELDKPIQVDIAYHNDYIYSYARFIPEISTTYIFKLTSDTSLIAYLISEEVGYIGDPVRNESGELIFEVYLEAGVTYYFDMCAEYGAATGEATIEMICPGHVGGQATYTECAVCDICGKEYGELLPCPGHFGGEATYQESAICEECGFHYGDKLYCDHMCHKDGIYAIIWGIFDDIYDYLGIETECKCGEEH